MKVCCAADLQEDSSSRAEFTPTFSWIRLSASHRAYKRTLCELCRVVPCAGSHFLVTHARSPSHFKASAVSWGDISTLPPHSPSHPFHEPITPLLWNPWCFSEIVNWIKSRHSDQHFLARLWHFWEEWLGTSYSLKLRHPPRAFGVLTRQPSQVTTSSFYVSHHTIHTPKINHSNWRASAEPTTCRTTLPSQGSYTQFSVKNASKMSV
jgi:hypothetical protein